MNWRQEIIAYGKRQDREIHESDMGLGIEFGDGFDAFWILPGEVFSTFPCEHGADPDLEAAIAAYESLDADRKSAIHIIRHHLAAKNWGSDRNRSGRWHIACSGASNELHVGEALTRAIRDRDLIHAVRDLFSTSFGVGVPTEAQCKRYQKLKQAPGVERSFEEGEEERSGLQSVPQALAWMGLCALMDDEAKANAADAEVIIAAVKPKGPVAQALLQMGERLPGAEAYCDLIRPGELNLEFSDGNDSMIIKVRSKNLGKRVSELGSKAAGDELAQEYIALDLARREFLGSIHHAAAGRAWNHAIEHSLNAESDATLYLGKQVRELGIPIGVQLSNKLRESCVAETLRELIEDDEFADECVAALQTEAWKSAPKVPEARLKVPPRTYDSEAPKLLELTAELFAEMNRFADECLDGYYDDPGMLWRYTRDEFYAQGTDSWANAQYWLDMAEAQAASEWPHPVGILALLDADHPKAKERASQLLGLDQDPDSHEEIAEIVWRCRHQHPESAREYFLSAWEQVPYAEMRAKYGDPTALRKLRYSCDLSDNDDCMRCLPYLSEKEQQRVHEHLCDWAKNGQDWNPPDTDCMRALHRMGWKDVVRLLEENESMLRGLLTIERREQGFDEPGALMCDDFLLLWSRLSPSPFLASLVATIKKTDLVALAREASRRAAELNPSVKSQDNTWAYDAYESWWKDLKPVLAIAWRRCVAAEACKEIT